jgi:serine protease Do
MMFMLPVSRAAHPPGRWRTSAAILLIALLCALLPALPAAATDLPAPAQQGGEPVTTLDEVENAVIQIEAEGAFVDPVEGAMVSGGYGSGFIIDPKGIAVTNNHVVTGGAIFRVYVAGRDGPVNARVLGVSECADLAVIDLDGSGYDYLTWYDGPIKVGLDVYAAGFPLGDPEFTLTRGIVAKARADGESSWASIDGVIQHDATINPGNSGGPLVDANGAVVAVNYASNDDAVQYFAISKETAIDIVATLAGGEDLQSLGINGEAFLDEESGASGVYVYSVASGSPADDAGISGGDYVISLEGLPLAEDGAMSTYCHILRSHGPEDVLSVEVYRPETDQVLTGQINGRPLEPASAIAAEIEAESAPMQAGETYTEFAAVSHSSGAFSIELPVAWSDVSDTEWEWGDSGEVVGVRLDASPDLEAFYEDWGIPGVIARYSESLPDEMSLEELIDAYDFSDTCDADGREELTPGYFVGYFDYWTNCAGNEDASALVLALTPGDTNAYYMVLSIFAATAADIEATDRILDSLTVFDEEPVADSGSATTALAADGPLLDEIDTSELSYTYVQLTDPALVALVPEEYGDIDSAVWLDSDGATLGRQITLAPSIDDFNDFWNVPGVVIKSAVGMEETLDWDEMLASDYLAEHCVYDDRYSTTRSTDDVDYEVQWDLYTDCGGEENAYGAVLAQSDPPGHIVFIDFVAVTEADAEAFTTLLASFYIDPELLAAALDAAAADAPADEPPAIDFVSISDDSGTITLNVPESWADVVSADWEVDDTGPIGVSLTAAPDVEEFNDRWDVPGIFIGVSEEVAELTPTEAVDLFDFADTCTYDDRYDYSTDAIDGVYDVWTECDGVAGESFIVFAANPAGASSPLIFFYVNLMSEADLTAFSEVLSSLAVRGALAAETPAVAETLDAAVAVVQVEALNVRSGPGTGYNRVGVLNAGDAPQVTGQVDDCAWLAIVTGDGVEGWIAGGSRYVTLSVRCSEIPAATAPPPATSGGAQSGSSAGSGSAAPTSATQGCYLIQNHLGAELTVTVTRADTGKGETFRVAGGGEVDKCLDPGRYTYTIDAPPPWGTLNGEMTVQAGDAFLWPISGE